MYYSLVGKMSFFKIVKSVLPLRSVEELVIEFCEIEEREYIALCEYFEIPLEKENQVILDDEESFVI